MKTDTLDMVLSKSIPRVATQISAINYGGCGWYAYNVQRALESQGIESSIVLVSCHGGYEPDDVHRLMRAQDADTIDAAYNNVFDDRDNQYSFLLPDMLNGHIAIRVGGILYDSDGVLNDRAISGEIKASTMKRALRVDHMWNGRFLRSNDMNIQHVTRQLRHGIADIIKPLKARGMI
jgi:hypothetical protein